MTGHTPGPPDADWIPSFSGLRDWVVSRLRPLLFAAVLGTVGGIGAALLKPSYYSASTTLLISSGASGDLAQLRGLASQFGISGALGSGKDEFPPEIVAQLVRSPNILLPIVQESLFVSAPDVPSATLMDLLRAKPRGMASVNPTDLRAADAVRRLAEIVTVGVDRKTRAISISVRTRWPEVSTTVIRRITVALDSVVFETSRQRARSERRATAELISQQQDRLRSAESALASFIGQNRSYAQSPELSFDFDRLQREVSLHQQVLVSLTQAREQAQVRETQLAPALTIVEPPVRPVLPEPRRRWILVVIGMLTGLGIGVAWMRWHEIRQA